jgi:hypothetical protein
MLTMRPFNEDGTWGVKQRKAYILDSNGHKIYDPKKRQYKCGKVETTDWSDRNKAEEWRVAWADVVNSYFEKLGIDERIDHRSFERQSIEQIPTIHLGVAAHQMEKRGIKTDRGNINREIAITNKLLRELDAQISELQNWLREEIENTEPPTLADVIADILSRQGQSSGYSDLRNQQAITDMLNFLTINSIMSAEDFNEKFKSIRRRQFDISQKLNSIDKHIKNPRRAYQASRPIF